MKETQSLASVTTRPGSRFSEFNFVDVKSRVFQRGIATAVAPRVARPGVGATLGESRDYFFFEDFLLVFFDDF